MKTKMLNLRWPLPVRTGALLLLLSVLRLGLTTARADAISELASFSIFDKVDLAQFAKSDVKTAHGPPMSNPRFLAVHSCYVAPGSPAQQIEALRRWDPTRHRELKVFLHSDLPSNPTAASFEKFKNAPDNGPVRLLVAATQKLSPDLQISRDEAKKFSAGSAEKPPGAMPASVTAFWTDVLTARAKSFVSSGSYYVALTLYQMWPITVEGKASTLVWRGDMISAPSLGSLHGVERLGSESVMMKQISKSVTLFRRDTSGGR